MATVPVQIRIDEDTRKQANELFDTLGLSMSAAVNLFLRQCILRDALPFTVEKPNYRKEVLNAMDEANRIANDSNVKSYDSIDELFKDLEK